MKIDLSKPVRLRDFLEASFKLRDLINEKDSLQRELASKNYSYEQYNRQMEQIDADAKKRSEEKAFLKYVISIPLYLIGSLAIWLTGIEALQDIVIMHNVYLFLGTPFTGWILSLFLGALGLILSFIGVVGLLITLPLQYGLYGFLGYLPLILTIVCILIFLSVGLWYSEGSCKSRLLNKEKNKRELNRAKREDLDTDMKRKEAAQARLEQVKAELAELNNIHSFWHDAVVSLGEVEKYERYTARLSDMLYYTIDMNRRDGERICTFEELCSIRTSCHADALLELFERKKKE